MTSTEEKITPVSEPVAEKIPDNSETEVKIKKELNPLAQCDYDYKDDKFPEVKIRCHAKTRNMIDDQHICTAHFERIPRKKTDGDKIKATVCQFEGCGNITKSKIGMCPDHNPNTKPKKTS